MSEQNHPLAAPLPLLSEVAPRTPRSGGGSALADSFSGTPRRQRRFYGLAASAASGLAALAAFFLLPAPAPAPASAAPGVFISLPYAESGVTLERPVIVRSVSTLAPPSLDSSGIQPQDLRIAMAFRPAEPAGLARSRRARCGTRCRW